MAVQELVTMAIGAIVEMGVEGLVDKARRQEFVVRVLKKVGLEPDSPPTDFEGAYVYALIDFGVGKPQPVVELFRNDIIRDAFRRAFETGNLNLVAMEAQALLDWHALGDSFQEMDIDPKRFIEEFSQSFQAVIDRTRTVAEIRREQKLDQIISAQSILGAKLEQIVALPYQHAAPDEATERLIEERIFDARIDQARGLIEEGKAATAKKMLNKLAEELEGQEVSAALRFRLTTSIGASCLYLDENEEAARYCELALTFAPDNPKALANAGLAALVRGRYEQAIELAERALVTQPEQSTALSVLLQASARLQQFDELDESIIQVTQRHVESRRALATIHTERGEYKEAERLHRLNLESAEAEPQDFALLAQVIAVSTQDKLRRTQPLPWKIPAEDRQRLDEAEELLTRAVDAWALDENHARFHSALVLRASVRGMLGRADLALSDCQTVLKENPRHPQALSNGGLAALQNQDYSEAIKLFEQVIPGPLLEEDVKIPLAAAYLQCRRDKDALKLLAGDPKPGEPIPSQVEKLVLIAQASYALSEHARVEEAINRLLAIGEDAPIVLEAVALIKRTQGQRDEAKRHLQKALANAEGGLKEYIALNLADLHYSMGDFGNAVPLYELAVDPTHDIPPTRRYLVSLLNSGNWRKAYDLARGIRGDGVAIPVISAVEARVAEYIGDLERARLLYAELAEIEPTNAEHLLRAAAIDARRGRLQEAATELEASIDRFWDDPQALIGIAQILTWAGRPMSEVLRLAYRARRLGLDYPNIHLAYILMFLKADDDSELFKLQEVTVGTAVRLVAEGKSKWFTILEDEPVDRGRGEIISTDALAQKLLGRKQGDLVTIMESPYEKLSYEIAEVQSNYVRAFQETLENFGTLFPDYHPGLYRITVPVGDPTKLFVVLERLFQKMGLVHEAYLKIGMPLGQFSKLVGKSLIKVWSGLIGDSKFKAAAGSEEEQAQYKRLVSSATEITVELTALLTLGYLECLEVLPTRFERVFVAQALLDELTEDIHQEQLFGRGYGFLGRKGAQYIVEDVPPKVVERRIGFLDKIRSFVQDHCIIVPVDLALDLGQAKFENLESLLGQEQAASILVAKQMGTVLYSDDIMLRVLASNGFSVNGVWTQSVLQDSCDRGLLKADKYYDAITGLVGANYYYVSLNAATLIYTLQKQQWQVSKVAKVFERLAGPDTSEVSAIKVLADCVREVWTNTSILWEQKLMIMDLCLRTLARQC
jgi:tetratricopeptide (TPR) repeat protein